MGKKLTQEEFETRVTKVNPNFEITSQYLKEKGLIHYKCTKCNFEGITQARYLEKKYKCPNCGESKKVQNGINDIFTLRPDMADLMEDKELSKRISVWSHKYVWFICPFCGERIKNKPANVAKCGLSCPSCSSGRSYPNKLMFNVLKSTNICFKPEFSADWSDGNKYDFMFKLKGFKYVVEMDGAWHYCDNLLQGISKEDAHNHDIYKDNLSAQNGYIMIRIDCNYPFNKRFEYIKEQIIQSKLSDILDLSMVNWKECDLKSQNSDFRTICDIYDNITHDLNKISEMVGLSVGVIIQHLQHSEKIGYSTYCHKDVLVERNELRKNKTAKSNGIFLLCCETNEIFYSISSAKRYYGGNINKYLQGKVDYAGTLDDGTKLHWKKIDKCNIDEFIQNEQYMFVDVDFKRDQKKKEYRKFKSVVKCDQTGEYFINGTTADKLYGSHIAGYFCHNRSFSGILQDGTKLTWSKPSIDEILHHINNGGTIIS